MAGRGTVVAMRERTLVLPSKAPDLVERHRTSPTDR
jgi:hypothetical protein